MNPGNRKFIVAMSILVLSTFLVMFQHVDGDNFRDIVIGIMGLFGLANFGEHLAKKQQT